MVCCPVLEMAPLTGSTSSVGEWFTNSSMVITGVYWLHSTLPE